MRNQKRWNIILLTLVLLLAMTGCGSEKTSNVLSEISKTIGVDVSAGEVISESDSHGGFHGDGDRVIEIQFTDNSFSDQINARGRFRKAMIIAPRSYPYSIFQYNGADTAIVLSRSNSTKSFERPVLHSNDL